MSKNMRLDISVNLYGDDGTRLGINEALDMGEMDFGQIGKLLEAFHMIAEAAKSGRNVTINGHEMRYFR